MISTDMYAYIYCSGLDRYEDVVFGRCCGMLYIVGIL